MKIGILTFHFGINFGGVLQCYALQSYLEKLGHTVEIINFVPPAFHYYAWWEANGYRKSWKQGLINAGIKLCFANSQRCKFQYFREKYLNLSKSYTLNSLADIGNDYDAVIVGSDQVWNPSQRSHAAYFLRPFINFKGLRISYAACCATSCIDSKQAVMLKDSLMRFNHISVRNKETQCFVKSLIGLEPEIVVDPTMLIDFDFASCTNNLADDYILVYVLGEEILGGHRQIISKIKNRYGNLPVYALILSENKPKYFPWANKSFWDLGPIEWIMFFKRAKFIYTDSYHGLLFAIKNRKPFLAYYAEKERESRFIDLSLRYNLNTFIVNSVTDASQKKSLEKTLDYKRIDLQVSEEVQKSRLFLINVLKQ